MRISDKAEDNAVEIWASIDGFEGLYEVSTFGRVRSMERVVMNNGGLQHKHERILKQNIGRFGHCTVVLCKNGKTFPRLVHRLVATAFISNPDGKPVVDHIDTNPMNNSVSNLRWATVQENALNPLTRIHNSQSKKGHPYYPAKDPATKSKRISKALKGRKLSEERKKQLSEAHRTSSRAICSALENLAKAAIANKGRHRSEETKRKISESLKCRHKMNCKEDSENFATE
jgi:hypothetical protein